MDSVTYNIGRVYTCVLVPPAFSSLYATYAPLYAAKITSALRPSTIYAPTTIV